jgi:hypothetical protein
MEVTLLLSCCQRGTEGTLPLAKDKTKEHTKPPVTSVVGYRWPGGYGSPLVQAELGATVAHVRCSTMMAHLCSSGSSFLNSAHQYATWNRLKQGQDAGIFVALLGM